MHSAQMMNNFCTENNYLRLSITCFHLQKHILEQQKKIIQILSVHPKSIRLMCKTCYCSEVAMEQSAPTVHVTSTKQIKEPSNMGG
jgi:hypothetical protein